MQKLTSLRINRVFLLSHLALRQYRMRGAYYSGPGWIRLSIVIIDLSIVLVLIAKRLATLVYKYLKVRVGDNINVVQKFAG